MCIRDSPNNADPEWIKKEVERKASSRNLEIQSIRHSPLMYLSKESALIKTLMNVYEQEMGAGADVYKRQPAACCGGLFYSIRELRRLNIESEMIEQQKI